MGICFQSLTTSVNATENNLVMVCDCSVDFLAVELKWSKDSGTENGQGLLLFINASAALGASSIRE